MKYKKALYIALTSIILVVVVFLIVRNNIFKNKHVSNFKVYEDDLDIVYGSDTAILNIFFYSSYNCSFCRKFLIEDFPELEKKYIHSGKVKFILKPIALTNNESIINSLKIAVCINEYGNFEKLNELLLEEPRVIYTDEFKNIVDEFVEKDEFIAECMYGGKSENYILTNLGSFKALGLTGTPAFIINNKIYKGYANFNELRRIIDKEISYSLR